MPNSVPHLSTLTVDANTPRAAARHSDIEQVCSNVYMVRGRMPSTKARPLFERLFLYYSRTMTIVREELGDGSFELTLINTIRLNEPTLRKLSELGKIKHVVRLGAFHGVDDAFYLQRTNAQYWVVEGMVNAPNLNVKTNVLSNSNLPLSNARLFSFTELPYPEAIIVLDKSMNRPGVAITTDAIQNHRTIFDIDNSPLVSFAIWKIGLAGLARLGPIWLREQALSPSDKNELSSGDKKQKVSNFFKPQFERFISDYDFEILVPGHGWPIQTNAREAIRKSIASQLDIL